MQFLAHIISPVFVGVALIAASSPVPGWTEEQLQVLIMGLVVGGAVLLLSTVNAVLQIIRHFRPTPPHHQHYATKAELQIVKDDFKQSLKTLDDTTNSNFKEMFDTLRSMERSLGRLEGKS